MRLFIAIGLSPVAVSVLSRIRQQFEPGSAPDLRWSAPEGWHVTLQFLGAVRDERAACVSEQPGTIRALPVPVSIEGLGFL